MLFIILRVHVFVYVYVSIYMCVLVHVYIYLAIPYTVLCSSSCYSPSIYRRHSFWARCR